MVSVIPKQLTSCQSRTNDTLHWLATLLWLLGTKICGIRLMGGPFGWSPLSLSLALAPPTEMYLNNNFLSSPAPSFATIMEGREGEMCQTSIFITLNNFRMWEGCREEMFGLLPGCKMLDCLSRLQSLYSDDLQGCTLGQPPWSSPWTEP